MWQYNDEIITRPKEMVINDVRYPRQIFDDADFLAELGITSYTPPETADQRYYWDTTDNPKDVDTLKEGMIIKVKEQVSLILAETDWMVIRATEGGTAVPSDVTTYRTAIRTEGNTKETEINALTTIDNIIDYENASYTLVKKTYDDDGNLTETTTSTTSILNKCTYFTATNPLAEIDEAFVSLTED